MAGLVVNIIGLYRSYDQYEIEGDKHYLIEINFVDAEILIEKENLLLHLKQKIEDGDYWKIKVIGAPEDHEHTLPIATIINIDTKTVDVIFNRYF